MAFGGEAVDSYGVIRSFPATSMLTGLLANALGWRRVDRERHQGLEGRLIFAARIDREPHGGASMRDFQSAAINNTEQGWTTRGYPEGRGGGTYQNHLRYRDYFADMIVTVALRLDPVDGEPTLEGLAEALREPGRPLFIGRKPCLPSAPAFRGIHRCRHRAGRLGELADRQGNRQRLACKGSVARRRGHGGYRPHPPLHAYRPAQLGVRTARRWAGGLRGILGP